MFDAFFNWFVKEFIANIFEMVGEAGLTILKIILYIIAWVILIAIIVATLPLWAVPFLCWYFAVWEKREGVRK